MQKFFNRATVLVAIMALLLPVAAFAQTTRTTGALSGTVTDTSGAPLPGVTVTLTSPQLQGTRTEVTNERGEYTFPLLPPGAYRAEYVLSGIKSTIREGIQVHTQQNTAINVQMQLAVSETVTVTASQVVVDPTATAAQTVLTTERLQYSAVGSANRSYQNVLTQAPGVATTPGSANPQVSGANTAQNDWYVDGVNTTDPVTHTFGGNMAFDTIQEISIITHGKDAEYKSSGGTVNVITKSGGNEFSGSFDYRYNDPDFLTEGQKTVPNAPAYFGGPVTGEALRFNKAAQTDKSEQPQATLGGPIVRDRLWFFGGTHRPETSRQQPNRFGFQPGPRVFNGWNSHLKLTYTPFGSHTVTGKYTDSHATITNTADSSFFRPEADSIQAQKSRIYALSYDAVVTPSWLASAQISHRPGSLASGPMSGDLETIGVFDAATSIRSVNATNVQGRTSQRNELVASTTFYLERMGTHAFKFGINFDQNEFTNFNYATGLLDSASNRPANAPTCAQIIAQFGLPAGSVCTATITNNFSATVPQRLAVGIRNPDSTKSAETRSFYVQDEWRPIPRLTARLGLRYDGTTWDNDGGNPVPDFELWQPRVGLAYDVFNNTNTVIHAYGGKIGDENQLTLPNFGVRQPLVSLAYNLSPTTGQFTYVPSASTLSISGGQYDPNLRPSFSNQYSLGLTQRVFANTTVDVSAEYRTQKNLFEDYCGTDAAVAPCTMTNDPGPAGIEEPLLSNWRGIVTKIDSRPLNWLDFSFSWTRAWSRGSTESTQNQNTSFDRFPTHFINTYGYLSDDARDRLKLNGFARLPFQFILGTSWQWDSGTSWSVVRTGPNVGGTLFLEPRGSRRLPHFHQLDMQLQKNFSVRNVTFGLIGSVFNVLNTELPLTINGNAGTRAITGPNNELFIDPDQQNGASRLSPTFGTYTSFQRPRRYEVGVRFEF